MLGLARERGGWGNVADAASRLSQATTGAIFAPPQAVGRRKYMILQQLRKPPYRLDWGAETNGLRATNSSDSC